MNRQWLINYSSESTKTVQTESTWSCTTADAKHLVVKVTPSVLCPFSWNNNMHHIYLCECNSKIVITWTYSSHPWLWPAYVKSRFAFTAEIKALCLQLKRSGTEYAANQFFNIHFPSEKFHLVLTSCWWVITYLFFHPINMSSTWRHKFYWFWWFFGHFWSEITLF